MRTLLIASLVFLLLSTSAHAKIVFGSIRDGVDGVYVMDDDGSNQTLLIEDDFLKPHPYCWSPDGKHIVFKKRLRINSGYGVLFIMNADGTNIRQLTEDDGNSEIGKARFSPDGKFLVFNRTCPRKQQYRI